MVNHPQRIFDGVLPMKVKYEVNLSDWVYNNIVPSGERCKEESFIPDDLKDRIIYVENDCTDIWEWSEKVYGVIERA